MREVAILFLHLIVTVPNLRATDRILAGLCTLFICRARFLRSAIVLRPSTLLRLHDLLRKRKYRMLFWPRSGRRPGPKGPSKEIIGAVVAMEQRNPTWGCPHIAQQIALAFGIQMDKDVVRRILSVHYRPDPTSEGPSWLTFLGHAKDSLWSCDLFRCESATLRTQLGSDSDGSIYTSSDWIRRPQRYCGRRRTMPHVPARDSRARSAKVPQLGS